MESIHGHDVMHMIAETQTALPKAAWVSVVEKKYGQSARFHTCSAKNLNASELIDFIQARGKFNGSPQAMSLDASAICNHHAH
jgi:probable metal-binding protein